MVRKGRESVIGASVTDVQTDRAGCEWKPDDEHKIGKGREREQEKDKSEGAQIFV